MNKISPFNINQINNQKKIENPFMLKNLINNPKGMNNMVNNPMGMNNKVNNLIGRNNMIYNTIGMNNMIYNPMGLNNMIFNQMYMNNMMNIMMPLYKQRMINQPFQNPNIIPNKKKSHKIKFRSHNRERKIPDILLKNKGKKIESITFKVEKDKKPTNSLFINRSVTEIFNSLFKKPKKALNEYGILMNLPESEPLEILHYKFDIEKNEFYNFEKKSLIQGLILAYKNHFPITVSPDMIWLLILQGYARFMDKYHELVREQFVNFEGQKTLYIDRYGIPVKAAKEEDWVGIINEFVEQICDYVGEEIITNLQSDFSTTNAATLLTSQASIMSAMKHYFNFEVGMGGCGISSITLEGSLEDWKKIKTKLEYLSKSKFALNWWTKHLIPIIDNIIKTKNYYDEHQNINSELIEFWKTMIRLKGEGNFYNPHMLNGWIIKFIPNLNRENPSLYEELNENEVPDQILNCPLKIIEDSSNGLKIIYNCSIASGFYGMIQDEKTLTVRPVIGYAIVVEKKETSL